MGKRRHRRRPTFTSEDAAEQIKRLQRVFDQGFLTANEFEEMKRHLLSRVGQART